MQKVHKWRDKYHIEFVVLANCQLSEIYFKMYRLKGIKF